MRSLAILLFLLKGLYFTLSTEAVSQSISASDGGVEEIYIARSLCELRIKPTKFCAEKNIGFGSAYSEERFTFRSVATRVTDGRIVEANVQEIGQLHACFGSTSDPSTANFYAEGVLANVSFKGTGECRIMKQDFPEPGIIPNRCFLELRELPNGYIGGHLTTNSVVSRNRIGDKSDPSGYTQPSIATIRLWKRR
jgi:hypothetical protein